MGDYSRMGGQQADLLRSLLDEDGEMLSHLDPQSLLQHQLQQHQLQPHQRLLSRPQQQHQLLSGAGMNSMNMSNMNSMNNMNNMNNMSMNNMGMSSMSGMNMGNMSGMGSMGMNSNNGGGNGVSRPPPPPPIALQPQLRPHGVLSGMSSTHPSGSTIPGNESSSSSSMAGGNMTNNGTLRNIGGTGGGRKSASNEAGRGGGNNTKRQRRPQRLGEGHDDDQNQLDGNNEAPNRRNGNNRGGSSSSSSNSSNDDDDNDNGGGRGGGQHSYSQHHGGHFQHHHALQQHGLQSRTHRTLDDDDDDNGSEGIDGMRHGMNPHIHRSSSVGSQMSDSISSSTSGQHGVGHEYGRGSRMMSSGMGDGGYGDRSSNRRRGPKPKAAPGMQKSCGIRIDELRAQRICRVLGVDRVYKTDVAALVDFALDRLESTPLYNRQNGIPGVETEALPMPESKLLPTASLQDSINVHSQAAIIWKRQSYHHAERVAKEMRQTKYKRQYKHAKRKRELRNDEHLRRVSGVPPPPGSEDQDGML